ncbi:MAG: hypothetical protein LBT43_23060 [Prevotella sp.]|jgi:hypothetical protein|nr:hypothetical protein [Prevotella sp.]
MNLIKKGYIFNTDGRYEWSSSHACGPTVNIVNDKVWRIYYSTRDGANHSRPSYLEVEAGNPEHILYVHNNFLFDLGKIGTFDDCGITISSICDVADKKYMYYLGWTVRNTVSYHNSMGLAISDDGGKTFGKFSEGPLLQPTYKEPYCNGATYTLKDGDLFRLYYTSFEGWEVHNNHPEPVYNIKYAESMNGIDWERNQIVSVPFLEGKTGGIARPSVIKERNDFFRMWYTYRDAADYRTNKAHSYRIGYAESSDGKTFFRMDDKAGVDISPLETDWDGIMQTYPCVVKHNGLYWMFYNGNGFGKSGFGYALLGE